MREETREKLILFNEKVARLRQRDFTRLVEQDGTQLQFQWEQGQPPLVNVTAPDAEAVDALVVTLRMFMQNNDAISLGNMSKLLLDPDISQNWKDQFNDMRGKFNDWMNQPGMCQVQVDGHIPTRWDILETFIYGEIAHTSEKKRRLYQQWKENPILFPFIEYEFKTLLMHFLEVVFYVQDMNFLELVGDTVPPLGFPDQSEISEE